MLLVNEVIINRVVVFEKSFGSNVACMVTYTKSTGGMYYISNIIHSLQKKNEGWLVKV